MAVQISIDAETITQLCRRHHIRKLSLFGSVLRDDFGPQSDVDVLVEFDTEHIPGFGLFDIQEELSGILHRPVDLVTRGFLSPFIRDRVEDEAVTLYDAR